MDIIQSPELLHALAQKVIHPHFFDNNKLVISMHQCDLWIGLALVGGLFSHTQLMQIHEFFIFFDAMKKLVDNRSFIQLKNALQTASCSMGVQLVECVKKVSHALIDLQRVSNVSSSMDMGNL